MVRGLSDGPPGQIGCSELGRAGPARAETCDRHPAALLTGLVGVRTRASIEIHQVRGFASVSTAPPTRR
jgi:hypothetical protein